MEQTNPSQRTELTSEQYALLKQTVNGAPVRATGTEDGVALIIAGEKIQLPNPTCELYLNVDYQTVTYEIGPFEVEMELKDGIPRWTVNRRVATDGGVDIDDTQSLPPLINTLSTLREGDQIVFETTHHDASYRAKVASMKQQTVDGESDGPRMEVVSAYVDLESQIHPFDGERLILHAGRPVNGDWPDDDPIAIDDLMHVEDASPIKQLYRIERANGVGSTIPTPEGVAQLVDCDVLEDLARRCVNRVEQQWIDHRRSAAMALLEAGFRTSNLDVCVDREEGEWSLTVTHSGELKSLESSPIDITAAERDFCDDVLAEVCEQARPWIIADEPTGNPWQ